MSDRLSVRQAVYRGLVVVLCACVSSGAPIAQSPAIGAADPVVHHVSLRPPDAEPNDRFGSAAAADGDTVVIGAPDEDSRSTVINGDQADNGAAGAGAAYVFVRLSGAWVLQAYLKASDTAAGDAFGTSVAISSDTVVVGAPGRAAGAGAAYVFVRTGTNWAQEARLQPSNPDVSDRFGASVAVAGDMAVVGAPGEASAAVAVNGDGSDNSAPGAGAAYVFGRAGQAWTERAYLKADTVADGRLGTAVSAGDGTAVVGAPGAGGGAVHVFVDIGGVWTAQARLTAPQPSTGDALGDAVALSGDTLVAGAPNEDSGATGVGGDASNDTAPDAGAAHVWLRSGAAWTYQAYLKASNTETMDRFGGAVAIRDDRLVVGAAHEASAAQEVDGSQADNGAPDAGAAYVFERAAGIWLQSAYLKAPDTNADDGLGWAMAAARDWLVAGAPGDASATGAAHLFTTAGADLVITAVGDPPAMAPSDGSPISLTDSARNDGLGVATASTVRFYLSTDGIRDAADERLTGERHVGELAAGDSSAGPTDATLPEGLAAGAYYVIACADDLDLVTEANESNNCTASSTTMMVHAHAEHLPHNIPDFGTDAERAHAYSRSSGAWTNPATWGGVVPGAGHIVHIARTHIVRITDTAAQADTVVVEGQLVFEPSTTTRLRVATLMVKESGRLEMGTVMAPVDPTATAELLIANKPLDTTNDGAGVYDPEQFGTGLLGFGTVVMHGAAKSRTFVRLAVEPRVGATSIQLAEAVTGWRAGDRLVLPDTRHVPYAKSAKPAGQWEEATVASVNGTTVTLQAALKYDHLGFRNEAGATEHFPHVANLSRNVIVRSESPTGTRGHVIFTHRAAVDIAYVWFKDLGRTKADALNNTTFDASGAVTAIGTNQVGRYSLHLHHLMGPVNSANTGYQYSIVGSSLDGGLKWAMAIHNTHFGLVRDNTVYNFNGGGIVTEQGNESQNVIERNFVARIYSARQKEAHERGGILAPDGVVTDTSFEGSGFWFRGPHNYVRDNVASDVSFAGFNYNGYYLSEIKLPRFRGADTDNPAESVVYGASTGIRENVPTLESARNEAYGYMIMGLWLTWHGGCCSIKNYVHQSYFNDYVIWHVSHDGVEAYHESRNTFDRLTIKNSKSVTAKNEGGIRYSVGFDFNAPTYEHGQHVIRNAHIEGFNIGIDMPANPNTGVPAENVTEIVDSFLKNYVNVNEKVPTIAKESRLRNILFATLSIPAITGMPAQPKNIHMSFAQDKNASKIMLLSRTLVYDYNRQPGSNFQVFFNEQAPKFVVPKNTDPAKGVPVSGLTNTQAWARYGRAIGGANPSTVCSATKAEITGFVCPLP